MRLIVKKIIAFWKETLQSETKYVIFRINPTTIHIKNFLSRAIFFFTFVQPLPYRHKQNTKISIINIIETLSLRREDSKFQKFKKKKNPKFDDLKRKKKKE